MAIRWPVGSRAAQGLQEHVVGDPRRVSAVAGNHGGDLALARSHPSGWILTRSGAAALGQEPTLPYIDLDRHLPGSGNLDPGYVPAPSLKNI